MKEIYYKNRTLGKLSESEFRVLTILLPYWGLVLDEHSKEIFGGLERFRLAVTGLPEALFQELSARLRHTAIRLENESNENADQEMFVVIEKSVPSPVTLTGEKMTYYLKPLRKETTDLQKWIHKRLWLPFKDSTLHFTFHRHEEQQIPEWLSYLVIQSFMGGSFQSLSDVSYSRFESLVSRVMEGINPEFANGQLSLEDRHGADWPQLPTEKRPQQENGDTIPPENAFNPFKRKSTTPKAEPMNPFQNKNKPAEGTTINPFRKK
jgi:hypothetical protein